jgi:hypothetical protein
MGQQASRVELVNQACLRRRQAPLLGMQASIYRSRIADHLGTANSWNNKQVVWRWWME